METAAKIPEPDDGAALITAYTGLTLDPATAQELWPKILQHKWVLSEKLRRDVGLKVACVDYLENIEQLRTEVDEQQRIDLLKTLGAHRVDRSVWQTISETQPPKQIVKKRIILPLTRADLAAKHGVTPPRTIIFFGPPGTGKTHFVRAIAAILRWWYVEISPSNLMKNGVERLGANLKRVMEKVRTLDEAVIFIDEFEEIAGNRDHASRMDKSITNELLKQVPELKRLQKKNLLICATNYIRELDHALLRPGRFDCIIPVGGLDDEGRRTIFEHYLSTTNRGEVDTDKIISMIPWFTPADIEFLFQKVKQAAFERELDRGENYLVTTRTFEELIPEVRPTLTDQIVGEFEEDSREFTRF
jgi:SpoVK/Ycf46/Vps4 family AAA+-type ATPase